METQQVGLVEAPSGVLLLGLLLEIGRLLTATCLSAAERERKTLIVEVLRGYGIWVADLDMPTQ